VKDVIRRGDQASELARSLARLMTAGVLAVAMISTVPPRAKAQQDNGATSLSQSNPARPAPRTDTASTFDLKIITAITSDYNYRGYTLSDHRPSISANIEATYDILFAAVNMASVRVPTVSQLQMTDYAGIRPVFGPLTVETGIAYYSYPGSSTDISYPEYYVAPSYALSPKLTVSLNAYYAPNYSQTGAWENYNSIAARYTFDSGLAISGELGRQRFGTTDATAAAPPQKLPDYTYWNMGLSYSYKALTFDLRYIATTLSKQSCFLITGTGQALAGSNGCSPAVVATLSLNTALSDLKRAFAGSR
jgi:uncharacterized protein (TIGR02001 family)